MTSITLDLPLQIHGTRGQGALKRELRGNREIYSPVGICPDIAWNAIGLPPAVGINYTKELRENA